MYQIKQQKNWSNYLHLSKINKERKKFKVNFSVLLMQFITERKKRKWKLIMTINTKKKKITTVDMDYFAKQFMQFKKNFSMVINIIEDHVQMLS